jgi:hypothetical protein
MLDDGAGELVDDEAEIWSWAERRCGHNWIYRGQRDAAAPIRSSLERTAQRFGWSRPRADLEMGVYRRFQRHAHLHVGHLPLEDDVIEWLAMLRHFGAPSRLVDWSYSFHIALFFAMRNADPNDDHEDVPEGERRAAVWAIDSNWLEQRALDHLARHGAADVVRAYRADLYGRRWTTFGAVYNREPALPFVLKQNCWRLNERLVAQQGVFLCPGDVERGFEDNLSAMVSAEDLGTRVRKLVVPKRLSLALMRRAHRSGISFATLQPGFEGFVRSIGDLASAPEVLAPSELAAPLGTSQPGAPRRAPRDRVD